MKGARQAATGFTLIEVILFLAIAGLMMVGIFAAANNNINNQRYSTAVTSLASYFQDQYSSIVNVHTNLNSTQVCAPGVGFTGGTGRLPYATGASDCAAIGRFITVSSTAKQFISRQVYITKDIATTLSSSPSCAANDLTALGSTCLNAITDDTNQDTYTLEWDTAIQHTIAYRSSDYPLPITQLQILIYRSPLSGQVTMMWSTQPRDDLTTFITANPVPFSEVRLPICVDPSGWTTIPAMGVLIDTATVGSSNAISRLQAGQIVKDIDGTDRTC